MLQCLQLHRLFLLKQRLFHANRILGNAPTRFLLTHSVRTVFAVMKRNLMITKTELSNRLCRQTMNVMQNLQKSAKMPVSNVKMKKENALLNRTANMGASALTFSGILPETAFSVMKDATQFLQKSVKTKL